MTGHPSSGTPTSHTTISLGEFLRSERERKGLTLEQVAAATKIGYKVLHAIECDQPEHLPAKPFLRGFIISYCRLIGLDPKEVLARYALTLEERSQNRTRKEVQFSGYAFEKKDSDSSRLFLWITMSTLVVLGGFFYILFKPLLKSRHAKPVQQLRAVHASPTPLPSVSAPVTTEASPSPSSSVSPSTLPSPEPVMSATPTPPVALDSPDSSNSPDPEDPLHSGRTLKQDEIKHKLVIKALANTWVRYRCDNRPENQFVLATDKTLVLRGIHVVQFQASNPRGVKVSYNQRAWKPLSEAEGLKKIDSTGELLLGSFEAAGAPQLPRTALPRTPDPVPLAPTASPSPNPASTAETGQKPTSP